MNSYGYARDNPIVNSDPTGLYPGKSIFRGLDLLGNFLFGRTVGDYFVTRPNEGPQELANDSAQFYVDGAMVGAGAYVGSLSPPGIALNVGGLSLYGLDTYCASKPCSNFEGAQYMPAGAILDSIPKPNQSMNSSKSLGSLAFQSALRAPTVEARQAVVNSLNTVSRASTPQDKLWVTPSGAIVTWSGEMKAGPASSFTNSTK